MTPEDVESRLQLLQTPAPPERLRERCLSTRPAGRRMPRVLAVAASFLVVGLSVWLTSTPKPSAPRPDKILPPAAQPSPLADDPVLKDKIERLQRQNPGMGILVLRVKELRGEIFVPVTRDFGMRIFLTPAAEKPDPIRASDGSLLYKDPAGPSAEVDLDGTMLFVWPPGSYRAAGFENSPKGDLKKLYFTWNYRDVDVKAGGVLLLSDAVFAPRIQWVSPEGSELSLKEDSAVSWAAYPTLGSIRIEIQRVNSFPNGSISWDNLGRLKRDYPKDHAVPVSELLKACKTPFRSGDTIALSIKACGRDGMELSEAEKRKFRVRD
jgi:hypothetical protein